MKDHAGLCCSLSSRGGVSATLTDRIAVGLVSFVRAPASCFGLSSCWGTSLRQSRPLPFFVRQGSACSTSVTDRTSSRPVLICKIPSHMTAVLIWLALKLTSWKSGIASSLQVRLDSKLVCLYSVSAMCSILGAIGKA